MKEQHVAKVHMECLSKQQKYGATTEGSRKNQGGKGYVLWTIKQGGH